MHRGCEPSSSCLTSAESLLKPRSRRRRFPYLRRRALQQPPRQWLEMSIKLKNPNNDDADIQNNNPQY